MFERSEDIASRENRHFRRPHSHFTPPSPAIPRQYPQWPYFARNHLYVYDHWLSNVWALKLCECVCVWVIRLPVRSNGRPYKMLVMFIFIFFRPPFSEFRRPIALKLCHLIGIGVYFITQVQKLGGHSPQKIRGSKTCKISVDFGPLQTLISNISGTAKDIQNRPTMAILPAFNEKSPVNFGPLTAWNYMWVWTQ